MSTPVSGKAAAEVSASACAWTPRARSSILSIGCYRAKVRTRAATRNDHGAAAATTTRVVPIGRAIRGQAIRIGDRARTTAGAGARSDVIPAISGAAGAAGSRERPRPLDATMWPAPKTCASVKWLTNPTPHGRYSLETDKKTGGVAHAPRVCRVPCDRERSTLAQAP